MPRPEGPFERLLKQRPQRDPAPIIIGGTIGFLALVIIAVFVFSSLLGGGGGGGASGDGVNRGGGCSQIAEGVRGCLEAIPDLPPGLSAVSRYIELEVDRPDTGYTLKLPLNETETDATGLGFYTFQAARWQRVLDVELTNDGTYGQGAFQPLPANLAVLRVTAQAYIVGASLPNGAALHGNAGKLSLITPRDFAPVADGSIQGTATQLTPESGTLIIPTIVGSGDTTAAAVETIIRDESLRKTHADKIAQLVSEGGFDGIDLEYSSVGADNAGQFTALVQAVAGKMHSAGKKLVLTLPPPSSQQSAYQWDKLGEVADYIKILPIADPVSYWQTMPDALGVLSDHMSTAKILLVVSPFAIRGKGEVSQPMGYLGAMALASTVAVREPTDPAKIKPDVQVELLATNLDESEGATSMRWDEEALAVSFSLGGTEHDRIYIENAYSVAFKLELVQAYALGGVVVADGSASSDVANVWPKVRELIDSATVLLRRPNEQMLQATWQAPDGGDLQADSGSTRALWTPRTQGEQRVVLVVSDGERRFGQAIAIGVGQGDKTPTPSPLATFAPSGSPTPGASPTGTPAAFRIDVGMLADGDDPLGAFSNDEKVTPASQVTYLVTFDNDADVPVTVVSLIDNTYENIVCKTGGGSDIIGGVLAPDDGDAADGPGGFNQGADEMQCTFVVQAPADSGVSVTNRIRGTAQSEDGSQASDSDDAKITTS